MEKFILKIGRHTLEDAKQYALSKGGKCLSNKYINNKIKLKWQCSRGHIWKSALGYMLYDKGWCPRCSYIQRGEARKLGLAVAQKLAHDREGKCLSTKYVHGKAKLKWLCLYNHSWLMSLAAVKNGQWCPMCASGRSERICREYFERICGSKFPKKRPKWLVSSQGTRLELDGYSQKLKLAFEYHGKQHYVYSRMLSESISLKERKALDSAKRELCKKNGIKLVEIPYSVSYQEMGSYIVTALRKINIKVSFSNNIPNYLTFNVYSVSEIKAMQDLAFSRGGKCLSQVYVSTYTPLKWTCKQGHIWKAVPNVIVQGSWCPECFREGWNNPEYKYSIEDMQKLAISKGGKCLSDKYIGALRKLEWQCTEGHKWFAKPNTIMSAGRWCQKCSYKKRGIILRKYTINDIKELAIKKGGRCLSPLMETLRDKLEFECSKGHKWNTHASGLVYRNTWCPYCSQRVKLTIEKMNKIAEEKGGVCLSREYKNNKSKLKWKCNNGHAWEANANSVMRGQWCPYCRNKVVNRQSVISVELIKPTDGRHNVVL